MPSSAPRTRLRTLRAKAGAIDELADSGVLDTQLSMGGGDIISRELAQVTADQNVESELATMRASLPAGDTKKSLPSG